MAIPKWPEFVEAVANGAVLVLNPATYQDLMSKSDAQEKQFLMEHSRTSSAVPETRALAVFTHQEEIPLGEDESAS